MGGDTGLPLRSSSSLLFSLLLSPLTDPGRFLRSSGKLIKGLSIRNGLTRLNGLLPGELSDSLFAIASRPAKELGNDNGNGNEGRFFIELVEDETEEGLELSCSSPLSLSSSPISKFDPSDWNIPGGNGGGKPGKSPEPGRRRGPIPPKAPGEKGR